MKFGEKGAKPECVFKQCGMRGREWRRPRRPRTEAGRSRKWRTRDRRRESAESEALLPEEVKLPSARGSTTRCEES